MAGSIVEAIERREQPAKVGVEVEAGWFEKCKRTEIQQTSLAAWLPPTLEK